MGCDIHLMIEYRPSGSRDWAPHDEVVYALPRDYRLFDALAGVRSDKEHGIRSGHVKGFPSDVNPQTMELITKEADHSFSYTTSEEYIHLPYRSQSPSLEGLVKYIRNLPWVKEWRLVYGFDS